MEKGMGKVWLVGAGPGDPELLTLRGERALREADVVVYDRLVGQGVLSRIPQGAEKIDVGKRAGLHPVPQEEICRMLVRLAGEGKRVVRLKGGDPFVFGRGGEELEALLAAGIPCEVAPGISSALGATAYGGIPVTHRGLARSFHVFTGRTREGKLDLDFSLLAKLEGTLVFLMGVGVLPELCRGFLQAGLPPAMPCAIVEQGTTARQRVIRASLGELPEAAEGARVQSPALIVVGEVCRLELGWAQQRPLAGLRLLVARTEAGSSRLAEQVAALGGEPVVLPLLRQEDRDAPWPDWGRFSVAAFLSREGVKAFFRLLRRKGGDIRELAQVKLAAVGPGTAEALEEAGLRAGLVPGQSSGRALGELLAGCCGPEDRVLLVRAEESDEDIDQALGTGQAAWESLRVYRTVACAPEADWVDWEGLDYLLFASSKAVRVFGELFPGLRPCPAVCIGEKTAQAARGLGMEVLVSRRATIPAMLELLAEEKKRRRL